MCFGNHNQNILVDNQFAQQMYLNQFQYFCFMLFPKASRKFSTNRLSSTYLKNLVVNDEIPEVESRETTDRNKISERNYQPLKSIINNNGSNSSQT